MREGFPAQPHFWFDPGKELSRGSMTCFKTHNNKKALPFANKDQTVSKGALPGTVLVQAAAGAAQGQTCTHLHTEMPLCAW